MTDTILAGLRYIPARYRYARRPLSAIRGWHVHMAEGLNVASYLSRNPTRGVSMSFCDEQRTSTFRSGEIVQTLPLEVSPGSVNPNTKRTSNDPNGFYGYRTARAVFGAGWADPNRYAIAIELAGRQADGPTDDQIDSLVALMLRVRRLPALTGLRGNTGHRDWQTVKPCPGLSPQMRRCWSAIQHGVYTAVVPEPQPRPEGRRMSTINYREREAATIRAGADVFDYPGGSHIADASEPLERATFGTSPDGTFREVWSLLDGKARTGWVRKTDVLSTRIVPWNEEAGGMSKAPASTDPAAVAAAKIAGYNEGRAAVLAAATAVPERKAG